MIVCSSCSQSYPFARFIFALNPFRVKCPHCGSVLRAGPYVKRNYIAALFLMMIAAPVIVALEDVLQWPPRVGLLTAMVTGAAIATVASLFNWRRGDYSHDR
jgi:hypothetical protein